MAKAVVAHGVHAAWQDMPEVAGDELGAGKGHGFFGIAVSAVFPAEGDMVLVDAHHAPVADGGLGDIGSEVFDGGVPGTDGADMDSPVLAPDGGVDLPAELLELFAEGLLESVAEGFDGEEKIGVLG